MATAVITPTTIDGIKRLAKSLSKRDGVTHSVALDRASLSAGYPNYKNARRSLQGSGRESSPSFKTYVSVWWRDPKTKLHGTEVIEVSLPKPLDLIVEERHFKHAVGLWNFKRWADDWIAYQGGGIESPERAIHYATKAARALQFMAATGLRPSTSDTMPDNGRGGRLPGADHSSSWFDPNTRKKLIIDEPYAASVQSRQLERQAWATRNNWHMVKSVWRGLYFPDGGSELYLLSDAIKGVDLEPVEAALASFDEPVVPETCKRVAAKDGQPFRSPGDIRKAAEKAVADERPRRGDRIAQGVPYKMALATGKRPNAKMSVEQHKEVGTLLKGVLQATRRRVGVHRRVDRVRSELDNWVQMEYGSAELPDTEFFELYYGQSSIPATEIGVAGREANLVRLQSAQRTLRNAYPDCKPLRDLINKLDLAIKSLQTWA
jgi:hypothetical protein